MTLEADVGCLKTIEMFRHMDPARLKLVALMAERIEFTKNACILQQGRKPDAVYFVLSGEVEIARDSAGGRFHALTLEKGAFFGAAAVLTGSPYPGDVVATTDVVALRLSKDLFFELMHSVPEFSLSVARDLAARIYGITARVFENEPMA